MSGAGKSAITNVLAKTLFLRKINNYVLDGDNIRYELNRDLGFSEKKRAENIRRIGEVSNLFVDSGLLILTAFISPFQEHRDQVRQPVEPKEFIEIYVRCSLDECKKRDLEKL